MKRGNTYKAVLVEWIDSTMKMPCWFTPQKMVDETREPKEKFQTISYLVNQNKKEYVFASSIHFNEDGVENFGQIFTIPKGCVIKMKQLLIRK